MAAAKKPQQSTDTHQPGSPSLSDETRSPQVSLQGQNDHDRIAAAVVKFLHPVIREEVEMAIQAGLTQIWEETAKNM